jgi:hypothetical protein
MSAYTLPYPPQSQASNKNIASPGKLNNPSSKPNHVAIRSPSCDVRRRCAQFKLSTLRYSRCPNRKAIVRGCKIAALPNCRRGNRSHRTENPLHYRLRNEILRLRPPRCAYPRTLSTAHVTPVQTLLQTIQKVCHRRYVYNSLQCSNP